MSDQPARDTALETHRHVLLQAPAGSGKTTVLAQRFLAALAQVSEPEEVLAITFTRKAAAEMRERVLAALEDALPGSQPDRERWRALRAAVLEHAAARGWDPDEMPARLRIQTIDSLCHEIARAMPLLGRMHQTLAVVDDAAADYRAAAEETLRTAEQDPRYQADADLLLRRLDNDWERAAQLLAGLLPGRNRWLPVMAQGAPEELGARVEASLRRIIGGTLQDLLGVVPDALRDTGIELALAALRNRVLGGAQEQELPASLIKSARASPAAPEALPVWQAFAAVALKDDGDWRKQVNVNHGFPAADKALKVRWKEWLVDLQQLPGARARLLPVMRLPPPLIDAGESGALAAMARLLLLAAAHLKLVFRDRGRVDHSEIAGVARQALRDSGTPTELSVRQTLRVRHLLVDEFQDTSPDQLELVRSLVQGWEQEQETNRSLFLVGDPMQSIYLFRNSEVGLFLQTRSQGVGHIELQPLRLTRNFRSVPELVDWSNDAFERVFPAAEDIRASAVTFLPSEAARAAALSPAVMVWPQASADPFAEASAIAMEIRRLQTQDPVQRIAVLVQTRALAAPILQTLRRAGLAAVGVDLASLSERPVVRDLISIGRALLQASDRTAWLSVLRAPFCGLALSDLHVLSGDDADRSSSLLATQWLSGEWLQDSGCWNRLSADGRQRLQRVAPRLLEAWNSRGSSDMATAIETLWRQLGGWQACRDAGERGAALQYLAAVRGAVESGTPVNATGLQRLAETLRDRGTAMVGNPVEVLTIHHSKGLEWDVVFVPGLGRMPRADTPPLLRWLELPAQQGQSDLLLAVRSLGEGGASDPLGRFIAGLQAERQFNERVRLAYVAVTRARCRLYLSGHAPWSAKQSAAIPVARSLLHILWPALQPHFAGQSPADEEATAAGRQPINAPWYRLPADFAPALRESPWKLQGFADGSVETAILPEFSWVGPLARAMGTVIHGELERLALTGLHSAADDRTDEHAARLRETGIDPAAAQDAAARIEQQIRRIQHDPRLAWMLDPAHREARSEWRLTGVAEGALRNVVIDRSFVDGGVRWVIDYKTGTHGGGSLEEFLQREMERYAPQLRVYRELAARTGPEPVRAALYFPLLGAFRELPG